MAVMAKLDDDLRKLVKKDGRPVGEVATAAGMAEKGLKKFLDTPGSSLTLDASYNLARAIGKPLAFGEGRKIPFKPPTPAARPPPATSAAPPGLHNETADVAGS